MNLKVKDFENKILLSCINKNYTGKVDLSFISPKSKKYNNFDIEICMSLNNLCCFCDKKLLNQLVSTKPPSQNMQVDKISEFVLKIKFVYEFTNLEIFFIP